METAAAILTKLLFEARSDLQERLRGIDESSPDAMALYLIPFYKAILANMKK